MLQDLHTVIHVDDSETSTYRANLLLFQHHTLALVPQLSLQLFCLLATPVENGADGSVTTTYSNASNYMHTFKKCPLFDCNQSITS